MCLTRVSCHTLFKSFTSISEKKYILFLDKCTYIYYLINIIQVIHFKYIYIYIYIYIYTIMYTYDITL